MGTNLYLWTKVLHIVMVTSWFAGLFYLPRIYVNLAQVDPKGSTAEYQRLVGMSQRLYRFMLPLATLAVLTGLVLYVGFGIGMGAGWMHVKLTCVLLLIGYHHGCGRLLRTLVPRLQRRPGHPAADRGGDGDHQAVLILCCPPLRCRPGFLPDPSFHDRPSPCQPPCGRTRPQQG